MNGERKAVQKKIRETKHIQSTPWFQAQIKNF